MKKLKIKKKKQNTLRDMFAASELTNSLSEPTILSFLNDEEVKSGKITFESRVASEVIDRTTSNFIEAKRLDFSQKLKAKTEKKRYQMFVDAAIVGILSNPSLASSIRNENVNIYNHMLLESPIKVHASIYAKKMICVIEELDGF